jgi:hypothetical protein
VRSSLRRKLTYSNVVSTLCLFVVLGGGAYAALTIPKNSVGSKQIKDGSVALKDIEANARDELQAQPGAAGAPGAPGASGASGADGSVVVARPFSSGVVSTSDSGSVTVPLSGNVWTAAAIQVDQLPVVGRVTYTPPNASCGGTGTGTLLISIEVNGQQVASGAPGMLTNGVQHTSGIAATVDLPEPGAVTARTAVVTVSDTCLAPADNVQIDSLKFDVIGVR